MAERYDREQMIEAIHKTRGKITLAAKMIGCARETIYDYARKYKTVQNAIEDARDHFDDELLDAAEIRLKEAVTNGEQWAIRYALDKKGSPRGWMDFRRYEHTGKDGDPVRHTVTLLSDLSDDELDALIGDD